jgi:hypothetical protein
VNTDSLRGLADRAEAIEGRSADPLAELHGRILRVRRQRAALGAATTAAAIALVVAGVTFAGSNERTQPPVGPSTQSPTPTPTPSDVVEEPPGQVTVRPEIGSGDIRGWELGGSITNTQPGSVAATDLFLTVNAGELSVCCAEGQAYVAPFCHGDPGTAWVLTTDIDGDGAGNPDPSDQGTRGLSGTCSTDDPTAVPPAAGAIGPQQWGNEGTMAYPIRMFVTDALTTGAQRCLTLSMDTDSCLTAHGLVPLDATDTTFGFGVYERGVAPTVMNVLGWRFEALAMADGVSYLVDRAIVSAQGSPRLVVQMPASDRSRIVAVYATETPELEDCAAALGHRPPQSAEEEKAQFAEFDRRCTTDLELRVDGRLPPTAGTDYAYFGFDGQALLPPGDARTVTIDVIKNDPRYVRYALVIWEERS